MDCRHHLAAPSSLGSPVSCRLSLPFALRGWLVPSLYSLLACLGLRGFGLREPWALAGRDSVPGLGLGFPGWLPLGLGLRGIDCLAGFGTGFPSGNGAKTFLKKSLARCGKFVPINTQRGENRRAKQTNTNRMNTAEITVAELLAAEGQAFTAKRDAWASVIFAHTAEELERATSAYQQATAAYSKAHADWYDAAKAANLLR